ncbi:hypothetical protein ACIRQO_15660 [Streptomyces anulatus]
MSTEKLPVSHGRLRVNCIRLAFVEEVPFAAFANFADSQQRWVRDEGPKNDFDVDEDRPALTWRGPVGSVKFVNDTVIRCQYVEINASSTVGIETVVRAKFRCYNKSEALAALDLHQNEMAVRRAYRLIACLAAEFEQRVFELTLEGFRSGRSDIRESALIVPQYTNWVDFLSDVERLSEADPSDTVRRIAGGIVVLLEFVAELEG